MATPTTSVSRRTKLAMSLPQYLHHPDFETPAGRKALDPEELLRDQVDFEQSHMPDEVTREHAKRMHYAAHRMHRARTTKELTRWRDAYLTLRDRIVLGNRKLVYRAVRRRMEVSNFADDLIGDCHIVLIQAVAVFNPWIGVRFSTYAYTCLVRALSRQMQRSSTDWLSRAISFHSIEDGVVGQETESRVANKHFRIEEFLRDDHPLLSHREKLILSQRFSLRDEPENQTLEKVGETVGLSKERVRQMQAAAIDKLRKALSGEASIATVSPES